MYCGPNPIPYICASSRAVAGRSPGGRRAGLPSPFFPLFVMRYFPFLVLAGLLLAGPPALRAQSQSRPQASSCGQGCTALFALVTNSPLAGKPNGRSYKVRNNTGEALDVKLYTERADGRWSGDEMESGVRAGGYANFWTSDRTGRYILFYRRSDSNDRFPSDSELTY